MANLILLGNLLFLVQFIISFSSVIFQPTQAQQDSLKNNQPSSSLSDAALTSPPIGILIETTTKTSLGAINQAANRSIGEVLLSANDFVDFTNETPVILLDGTSNNTEDTPASETTTTAVPITTPSPIDSSLLETPTAKNETVTTNSPLKLSNQTQSSSNGSTTTTNSGVEVIDESEDLSGLSEEGEEISGEIDTSKEIKPTFDMPKNVSQYMDYIERLFHDLRHQITDLFEPHIPQLIRTSQMVELSGSCSYDMLRMALALRQFEPWALRMIDSSGKMPEGIFEGSFTALGSYDECLNTLFASSSSSSSQQSQQQSQQITQGKYCLVNVSPFLPPKPPADRVERLFQEEANRRNYTKDDQFSRLSPMFYYMKFRIGVCIPSSCVDSDLNSISDALSVSLRLNITIPHCRVKQSQPITSHQLIGGLIFSLTLSLVIGATIMDCWFRKLDQLKRKGLVLWRTTSQHRNHEHSNGGKKVPANNQQRTSPPNLLAGYSNPSFISSTNYSESMTLQQPAPPPPLLKEIAFEVSNATSATNHDIQAYKTPHLSKRLEKHWIWLSFSLITNFKIYFTRKPLLISSDQLDAKSGYYFHPQKRAQLSNAKDGSQRNPKLLSVTQQQPFIKCLDGIRVLSLCWVILANSYITLDPRATKRLSVTREAPKDFLFQLVVQASLAIETFFFLSGILVSVSYARKFQQQAKRNSTSLQWIQFYVHRYIRMTPATMLVIAFTMFAFRYGDGPLWFEATHKAHMSCSENWWRHLLHVANFIDTRQMCFIHYWYIAADMQLFLFAPLLMFLLYKRPKIAYLLVTLIGFISIGSVFYTTYIRNLPPTLLFYNTDPESRREYGNTIMTKPLTHALPYMVGILVGKWLSNCQSGSLTAGTGVTKVTITTSMPTSFASYQNNKSLTTLFGLSATLVALAEVFLPYKWNNSHLPTRFLAAAYAALFRFFWSLALAYLVISCAHKKDKRCRAEERRLKLMANLSSSSPFSSSSCFSCTPASEQSKQQQEEAGLKDWPPSYASQPTIADNAITCGGCYKTNREPEVFSTNVCVCGSGGSLVNRLLGLSIFTHLSKLSFVAYLIHLPLMSVFVSQTRGLFAFSHTLVIHLALSYLVMTIVLSFVLVLIIEFPFITFERYLFEKLFNSKSRSSKIGSNTGDQYLVIDKQPQQRKPCDNSNNHIYEGNITSFEQKLATSQPPLREKSVKRITTTTVNGNTNYREIERGADNLCATASDARMLNSSENLSERL